ncbi:MAG: alpha/beta hydrolase family protein [Planctomycetota bacterium]
MFKRIVFLVLTVWSVQAAVAHKQIRSQDGSLSVEVADDLSIKDPVRKKELPFKVYYPKTGGPYPVIVFSHGFGGNKDGFGPVGKHWASQGYVVIHPSHEDGLSRQGNEARNSGGEAGVLRGRLGNLRNDLNNTNKISGRVADLVLVLDKLEDLPSLAPGLKGKIDSQRIGVAGHSFGAYTAMLIGGVTTDFGQEKGKSFLDKRVKCILPISAQGTGQQGLTEQSWDALRMPMMTITGTEDRGVGGQSVEWRKEPYKYSPTGDKYLIVIEGANHMSYGGALRIRGGGVTEIVNLSTTKYWDAYLKNSQEAKEYLQSDKLVKDFAGKCTLDKK